ncbi:hypothetical protein [Chryseobacterium sp. R2ACT005]|uniref:hypothetical protein n=1 Tax=Chryseobacterium sp. R2ACT005 TaxID=3416668 RepID=UPI003CF5FF8A
MKKFVVITALFLCGFLKAQFEEIKEKKWLVMKFRPKQGSISITSFVPNLGTTSNIIPINLFLLKDSGVVWELILSFNDKHNDYETKNQI